MRFRGRARRLQIHRGAADDAVAAWADNGGRIGLIAPERCGRTFLLGRATRTLSRLGTPYVHVDALGLPWGGVVSALDRLGEPPPWEVPADERAAVIAAQLHRHCLTGLRLIVDDVERQDPGTLRVLDRLADLGASMLVAGTRGPAWASRLVDIPPLASATDLLEAALRDRSAAEQLAGPASRTCEGAPGRVLDWLERALVAGAIAPRAGRWEVRAELLPTDAAPAPIPDDAAEFGALAAASRASMPASLLAQALGADLADVMRAIESLADRALVRFSGDLVTPTGPRAVELLRSAKAPSSALVALCERELERPGGDVIRAAWLAIESERPDVLGRAAPAAARRAAEEDPSLADPLLQALAERVSDPVVDAARVAQLRRQGRPHDAIALARSGVADRPWQRADAPVLLELGRIYEQHGDTESALRCVELLRTVAGPDAAPIETAMLEARLLLATGRSREALVAALPATRREPGPGERSAWTSLHLVAIAALEANGDDEGTAALLASLDLDALVGRDGVLLRAARARLIGRTEDAERAASELERMSNAPGLRRADRAELLRDSARAYTQVGDLPYAVGLLIAARRQRATEPARAAEAALAVEQAELCLRLCSPTDAHAAAARALALARGAPDRPLAARAGRALAAAHLDRLEFEDARARLAAAGAADPNSLAATALAAADAALRAGQADASERAALALSAAGDGPTDDRRAAELRVLLAGDALDDAVEAALDELARRAPVRQALEARTLAAERLLATGHATRAAELARPAVQLGDELVHLDLVARAWRVLTDADAAPTSGQLASVLAAVAESSALSADSALAAVAHGTRRLLDADRAFVVTADPAGGAPRIAAGSARHGDPGVPLAAVVSHVMRRGRGVCAPRLDQRPDLARRTAETPVGAVYAVPLSHAGRAVGVLYADARGPRPHGDELDVLTPLAAVTEALVGGQLAADAVDARRTAVSGVARALRRPLGGMVVATSRLRDALRDSESALDTLDGITASARELLELARQLQLDEQPPPPRSDAADLTVRQLSAALHDAARRRVRLELSLKSTAHVAVGPAALTGVLRALIRRAVHRTSSGKSVMIALTATSDNVTWVVRDQGEGAPLPEELDPSAHGALGLARQLADSCDGSLSVGDRPGRGGVVRLELPRADTATPPPM